MGISDRQLKGSDCHWGTRVGHWSPQRHRDQIQIVKQACVCVCVCACARTHMYMYVCMNECMYMRAFDSGC